MNEKFSYIIDNITLFSPTLADSIVGSIIAIIMIIGFRWIFLHSHGYMLVIHDAKEFEKKKDTLNDLILMKDIQTELEKEIEQAMLKATFQG